MRSPGHSIYFNLVSRSRLLALKILILTKLFVISVDASSANSNISPDTRTFSVVSRLVVRIFEYQGNEIFLLKLKLDSS